MINSVEYATWGVLRTFDPHVFLYNKPEYKIIIITYFLIAGGAEEGPLKISHGGGVRRIKLKMLLQYKENNLISKDDEEG